MVDCFATLAMTVKTNPRVIARNEVTTVKPNPREERSDDGQA